MNLPERYKKLKSKANQLLTEGLLNEYLKILNELIRLETQLHRSVQWN